MLKSFNKIFILISCLLLAACSASTMQINLTSSKHLNLDTENNSLPVVVRVYVLTNDGAFLDASFRELWRDDKAVLGNTMLDREEYTLAPNSHLTIKVTHTNQAKYFAVVGLFRHPHGSEWRVIHPMSGQLLSRIKIALNGSTLKFAR